MEKRVLLRSLRQVAVGKGVDLVFVRQGSRHEVYAINGVLLPVPRHNEIAKGLALDLIQAAKEA
ncbi:hypothetical protein ACPXCE_29250 [Streptomyces sp. DT24]|uniref:hypothetical protein n=1 Tax=Streptomyces sp. DT24 TaxID=3416520 RepID=UPI003CF5FCA8